VTVTLPASPALRGLPSPDTAKVVVAAGVTTIPLWVPVIESWTVSVAVTDCVPAVFMVTLKVPTRCPSRVGRKDCGAIGAGEMHGPGVVDRVAVLVESGDRYAAGVAGGTRRAEPRDHEVRRRARVHMKHGCAVAAPSEPVTVWSPSAVEVHEAPAGAASVDGEGGRGGDVAKGVAVRIEAFGRVRLTGPGGDRRVRGAQSQVVERIQLVGMKPAVIGSYVHHAISHAGEEKTGPPVMAAQSGAHVLFGAIPLQPLSPAVSQAQVVVADPT